MNSREESTKNCKLSLEALDKVKAEDCIVIDTHTRRFEDYMIICTARSTQHMKGIANNIKKELKEHDSSVEITGLDSDEWCIVSLNGIYIHIMTQSGRDRNQLEKLLDPDFELQTQFL